MAAPQMTPNQPESAPISAEEARRVPLSRRPFRRLGQLAALAEPFGLRQVGMNPLPSVITRGELVRLAEAHERARQFVETARHVNDALTHATETVEASLETARDMNNRLEEIHKTIQGLQHPPETE